MSTLHPHGDFTESVPGPSACRWYLRGDNCLRAGMDSSRLSMTVLFEFIQFFSHARGSISRKYNIDRSSEAATLDERKRFLGPGPAPGSV